MAANILTCVFFGLCLVGVALCATCKVGSDCGSMECCVLDKTSTLGVCQPMGDLTAYCYVRQPYAWSRPEQMVTDFDRCPCRTGYICGSINQFSAEYGQKGICSFGK
ncbi:uncharacterized protein LOC131957431 [Physella acuta]|uniref:uncharacterized protein LOC131957431 n=1 Tax=Physella acuta TaxID=109671 RepID=UPI0027DD5EB7|nr:uncharacterized protein LOC131957431 [Physella acuta]